MNWTDFFLYLSLSYVVYYTINVVFDVLRKPRLTKAKEGEGYTFQTDLSEFDETPTVIEDDDTIDRKLEPAAPATSTEEPVNSEEDSKEIEFEITKPNPVKSTGGVTNLDSLFALAKEGTIELKKSIVYS